VNIGLEELPGELLRQGGMTVHDGGDEPGKKTRIGRVKSEVIVQGLEGFQH